MISLIWCHTVLWLVYTLNIYFPEQEFSVGRFRWSDSQSFYRWWLPSCPSGSPSRCGTVSSVRRRKTTFPSRRNQPRPERCSWTSAWLAVKQENVFRVELKLKYLSADSQCSYIKKCQNRPWPLIKSWISLVMLSSKTFNVLEKVETLIAISTKKIFFQMNNWNSNWN